MSCLVRLRLEMKKRRPLKTAGVPLAIRDAPLAFEGETGNERRETQRRINEEEECDADDEADEDFMRGSVRNDGNVASESLQDKVSQEIERMRNSLDDVPLQMKNFRAARNTIQQIEDVDTHRDAWSPNRGHFSKTFKKNIQHDF